MKNLQINAFVVPSFRKCSKKKKKSRRHVFIRVRGVREFWTVRTPFFSYRRTTVFLKISIWGFYPIFLLYLAKFWYINFWWNPKIKTKGSTWRIGPRKSAIWPQFSYLLINFGKLYLKIFVLMSSIGWYPQKYNLMWNWPFYKPLSGGVYGKLEILAFSRLTQLYIYMYIYILF